MPAVGTYAVPVKTAHLSPPLAPLRLPVFGFPHFTTTYLGAGLILFILTVCIESVAW